MKDDERRGVVWGYSYSPEDGFHTADSIIDAVESATEIANDTGVAYVSAGTFPLPNEVAQRAIGDVDEVLERMEDVSEDFEIYSDGDELWRLRTSRNEAQLALGAVIALWAQTHVEAVCWNTAGGPTLVITPTDPLWNDNRKRKLRKH